MFIRTLPLLSTLSTALLLAACAGTPNVSGSWQDLGTTSNGNIKAAIDKSSIQRNGQLATFRDKKTVVRMSEERYTNTPRYKTAIGEWEIHCSNKTYRLTGLQLLDERGTVVSSQKYTATALRPMSVMSGSLTEKQYEIACGKKL